MKFITRLLLLLIACIFFINSYSQGFLKVSGKQIVNEKNENVLLRGDWLRRMDAAGRVYVAAEWNEPTIFDKKKN
jgi:hypothetical protein